MQQRADLFLSIEPPPLYGKGGGGCWWGDTDLLTLTFDPYSLRTTCNVFEVFATYSSFVYMYTHPPFFFALIESLYGFDL